MARISSCRSSPAGGGVPNFGDTTNVLIADSPELPTDADSTRKECSASTPAASESNPGLSGAMTVTM